MSGSSEERLRARLATAEQALACLGRGDRGQARALLGVIAGPPASDHEHAIAAVYRQVLQALQGVMGEPGPSPHARSMRLPCPACGIAFLEAIPDGFKQLRLVGACPHCDATLEELERHLASRPYPKDVQEVPRDRRLYKLEEELEHVRHLAGLEHPTTTTWERSVGWHALAAGEIERARALYIRVARRGSRLPLAALLLAEGKLAEAEHELAASTDPHEQELLAAVRSALAVR